MNELDVIHSKWKGIEQRNWIQLTLGVCNQLTLDINLRQIKKLVFFERLLCIKLGYKER
jgi:hypothetical protein